MGNKTKKSLGIAALGCIFIVGCRAPAQSAAQRTESAQRQTSTAGGDSTQETVSTTDQRQQQTSEAAPVAPQARDVGAMTVTARADFHDLGERQLALEQQRERSAARHQATIIGVLLGVTLLAFTTGPLFRGGAAKSTARLFALALIGSACLIPLLFP